MRRFWTRLDFGYLVLAVTVGFSLAMGLLVLPDSPKIFGQYEPKSSVLAAESDSNSAASERPASSTLAAPAGLMPGNSASAAAAPSNIGTASDNSTPQIIESSSGTDSNPAQPKPEVVPAPPSDNSQPIINCYKGYQEDYPDNYGCSNPCRRYPFIACTQNL